MKLFGYSTTAAADPVELAEVTLSASPQELKAIARFLLDAAKSMERMGQNYSHEHLEDQNKSFRGSPHFVVACER